MGRRVAWGLFALLLAGCHLAIDPDRHVGADAGRPDTGSPPLDTGPPDAPVGTDGGPDGGGGPPCETVGVDPACGPEDFATCTEGLRCRPCWAEQGWVDIYYEGGGLRPPEPNALSLAIVRDDAFEPAALLAWTVGYPFDTVQPVITAIPLAGTLTGPVETHLAPGVTTVGEPFDDLVDTHALAMRPSNDRDDVSEATLLMLGERAGGRVIGTAQLAVVADEAVMSFPVGVPTEHEPLGQVAVTGRSPDDVVDPAALVWREVSPGGEVTVRAARVADPTGTLIASVTDDLPGGGDAVVMRGSAGRIMLMQPRPTGDAYLYDASSNSPPTMRAAATGRADIAATDTTGEYVLAVPNGDAVELSLLRCADAASCGTFGEYGATYGGPVRMAALEPIEGGLLLAAIVDSPTEHLIVLRVLTSDLEAVPAPESTSGPSGLDWMRHANGDPYVALELAAARTSSDTFVIVASLIHTSAVDEHTHAIHTLRLSRSCPAIP